MKKNTGMILAAITTCSLFLTACAGKQTATETISTPINTQVPAAVTAAPGIEHTITVNSTEEVTVVPDIATVVFAVRTEAKTAADCQSQNTEAVNNVIETLKGLNITETSIQTSDYNMFPIYSYANNTQRITGYESTSELTVSDLPIEGLGSILSQSVSSGINNVQSISYMSSKYDESYQEALKLAVASAGTKAQALAEAGGCTLGGVVTIVENSNYSEARYTDNALMKQIGANANGYTETALAADESIMPGEVTVEVNITVEYLIN